MEENKILRHFCVTVYIFDKETQKFVFIRHKKLQKWFPAGGHIEENENPDCAARREAYEETGLKDLYFINPPFSAKNIDNLLIQPFGIQLNKINENHEHLDLIYLATINKKENLVLNEVETEGIQEFSLDEILDPNFDTYKNLKEWCKYFESYIKFKAATDNVD